MELALWLIFEKVGSLVGVASLLFFSPPMLAFLEERSLVFASLWPPKSTSGAVNATILGALTARARIPSGALDFGMMTGITS